MVKFYHSVGAKLMDDWTINKWIRDTLQKVKDGEPHWSIGSGDTTVVAMKYPTEIQVFVFNSSGKSSLRFSLCPGYEDPIEFEEYIRPVPVPA